LSANAADAQAVASVQFKVDGVNVGAPDTTAPYSYSWDSTSVSNGSRNITAVATNTSGLTATSNPVSVTVNNTATPPPTTPAVSLTAPTAGSTVSATITVSANASDTTPLAGIQFKLDGANLGSEDTTAPYSVSWDTRTATDGSHNLTAVARNTSGGTAISGAVAVTVYNPVAPTVSLTAPATNATVSGTTTLSANAADTKSTISSVQFRIDGANVGTADTAAPYSYDWDSTSVANGTHTVTAIATNSANLTTTSSPVTVTVNNTAVTPPPVSTNLIGNDSVENGTPAPTGWVSNAWGTNTSTLSYENTGRTGAHSVKAAITSYTNGDAKWYFNAVPVSAGKTYNYSNWYKSNVATELDAMVTMNDGSVQYFWLGTVSASPTDWQKASAQFSAPVGAVNLTIFQVVYSVGYVQSDDFTLTEYVPQQFNRAVVSLTFDDGWRNIYTNGFPVLQKYGLTSTQYLNSQPVVDGYPDYMTYQMVKDFAAAGHELGWHTRTHANVTTLSAGALDTELTIPTAFLNGTGTTASSFTNFATPFGAYNDTSVNAIMSKYRSHRSTDVGYNTKDNFNIRNIKVQNITNTTTPAQVQAWVNQAIADKSWLVIVYHEVTTNAADPTYAVTPANLDAELNIVKQSGVSVLTVQQALNEITAQY
jgi:peptidoglycan/xylan/chitin deacetylase (PgdA/CDA1 family)